MVDILDEVEEDIRQERMVNAVRRYGGFVVLAAILVVAAVAGQEIWQSHLNNIAQKNATQYLALTKAVDQPDGTVTPAVAKDTAEKLMSFAGQASETYKTLARMRAASLYAEINDTNKAAALWTRVAADEAAPTQIRDVANLLWAQHELATANSTDVLARLQLMTQQNNPYHGLARELQAMVYLHDGNIAMAKSFFAQVQDDPTVASGTRSRAAAMLTQLNG